MRGNDFYEPKRPSNNGFSGVELVFLALMVLVILVVVLL